MQNRSILTSGLRLTQTVCLHIIVNLSAFLLDKDMPGHTHTFVFLVDNYLKTLCDTC